MANQNGEPKRYLVRKRALALPKAKQKSDLIQDFLRKKRKHKKKWPEPEGAEAIFDMHFATHCHHRGVWHAEMTLEIPEDIYSSTYYTISVTSKTKIGALRAVIEKLEKEEWYHYFRKRGVRFRVTGELEETYFGYL